MGGGVAIVLGSSKAALDELRAALALAPDAKTIPVKRALITCPVPAFAYCTLHPEMAKAHLANLDVTGLPLFCNEPIKNVRGDWRQVRERWSGGTTALYATQIALQELGFACVILAGCPIDAAAGVNYALRPGKAIWSDGHAARYHRGWTQHGPALQGRVRSMSGWTKDFLGEPDQEWFAKMEQAQ